MRKTYLTLLAIGLAGFAAKANAQYYAPSPYAQGPYRAELIDDDDADGPDFYTPQPPGVASRAPASRSYETQPLPPPGSAYSPPPATQPPAYAQPQPPAYAPPQGSAPSAAAPPPTYAYPGEAPGTRPAASERSYGFEPVRPPGSIGGAPASPGYAPSTGYTPSTGYAPSSTDGPTGSISTSRTPAAPAAAPSDNRAYASLPPDYRPEEGKPKPLSPHLQRQLIDYETKEPAGTLIVDTPNTFLYLVLGNGKALRYGIGVGREGFTWSGVERVSKMAEWPDWHPPPEMIERQPYLPRFMAGGESSPLGARALYLGKTIYRIHGTNQPSTIGTFVSSGCIRLTNDDIQDLYQRVQVGTRVVVLPKSEAGHAKKDAEQPPSSAQLPTSSQVIR
ncbi:MAG: L,D-transpeptidase [Xanthobacteraceae bacterium]